MTTIKDVAREASVSTATVSRVLNNSGRVNEETRRQVHLVARRLKYVPNALGRGLSTKRTDAIGMLLPDMFGEFFSEVLRGSDQTAQQSHYHLIVSSSHSNKQEIQAALTMMRGRVDGLVIMSPHVDAQTLDENLPHAHPVVLLNCHVESNKFDSVNIDNFAGARAMTKHLLDHGHTRIAMIKGTEGNFDADERRRGYCAAMQERGVALDERLQVSGDFREASGYEAARILLGLSPRPTAIFASNDAMAIGALSALRQHRIQVPEEMALTGFDDVPVASFLSPALTSVRVDIHNLGVQAIARVLHAVRNGNAHHKQQVLLPTNLSVRQSCGCVPHTSSESTAMGGRW